MDSQYYPNTNYFPPPPGSAPRPAETAAPYNPADYPPPPGAVPPVQPYGYGTPPGPEPYAPRPRRADENVSAARNASPPNARSHAYDGGCRDKSDLLYSYRQKPANPDHSGLNLHSPMSTPRASRRRRRSRARSQPPQPKSVAFNLDPELVRPGDPGYESDDSDSTIDSLGGRSNARRRRSQRRHSSSAPHSSRPRLSEDYDSRNARKHRPADAHTHHHYHTHNQSPKHHHAPPEDSKNSHKNNDPENDSDSTIDLPDRFDSHGRLLPQRGDDPLADRFEDLLKRFSDKLYA